MAKLSLALIFAFTLVVLVISRTSEATDTQKCQKVLDPTNCNAAKCENDCILLYRNFEGTGKCLGHGPYACVCIYDCSANKFGAQVARGLI
ncbi:hypothetical protein CR513_17918, partial [Mucuna pruriens]